MVGLNVCVFFVANFRRRRTGCGPSCARRSARAWRTAGCAGKPQKETPHPSPSLRTPPPACALSTRAAPPPGPASDCPPRLSVTQLRTHRPPRIKGEKFEELYTRYEKEGRGRKQVRAQELWAAILESQIETGMPYMLFKDAANGKSNQQHLGTIKSSNLCTEIIEYTAPDETAVRPLAAAAALLGNERQHASLRCTLLPNSSHRSAP